MNSQAKNVSSRRFCVLQYIASEGDQDRADSPAVIAIVTSSHDGEVVFRVRPEWERIVLPADRGHLEALFRDFRMRKRSDPDALFRQLSDVSVGPLVTHEVGSDLAANPPYLRLAEWFQEI